MTTIQTLTDHILHEQRRTRQLTEGFHLLLLQIETASKIIASHIKASGLVDILGKTGKTNSFGEEVQKLDDFANDLLIQMLLHSGQVHALISEENKEPIYPDKELSGDYIVYFDPLDGSSNIDTNAPIGTIFSIYHKDDGLLQPGKKQVAAGYTIHGSSVMFVYTVGNGLNGFTLDPTVGSYLLSHPAMQMPEFGPTYSLNEAYTPVFSDALLAYLTAFKQEKDASHRYIGSLIADAHRTFLKGGIFMNPTTSKRPQGKLRLMLEVNPFAVMTEQAGGSVVAIGTHNPLDTTPEHIHERSPLVLGNTKNIQQYLSYFQKE